MRSLIETSSTGRPTTASRPRQQRRRGTSTPQYPKMGGISSENHRARRYSVRTWSPKRVLSSSQMWYTYLHINVQMAQWRWHAFWAWSGYFVSRRVLIRECHEMDLLTWLSAGCSAIPLPDTSWNLLGSEGRLSAGTRNGGTVGRVPLPYS